MDSNSRSPVSGDTPQRPRIAPPGIISAKSRLALRTKGFDPFAEILRASPESHRFLAKVPAPRLRDTPPPAFRKMRVQASGNSFPAYQKRGEPDRRQMADMLIIFIFLTARARRLKKLSRPDQPVLRQADGEGREARQGQSEQDCRAAFRDRL